MLIKHQYNSLLIEDFCEEILLEKQGLKNLVNNFKFQLYLDYISYFDSLDYNWGEDEDAKYFFDIFAYKKFFKEFIFEIKKLIEDKQDFFNEYASKVIGDVDYANPTNQKSLILISDIYSLDSKYFIVLGLDLNDDFLNVYKQVQEIYKKFTIDYFLYKHNKNVDYIFTGINLGGNQKFEQKKFEKSEVKKIIYLDTNAFSLILEKSEIKNKIILSKEKFQYCYSAYVLEDKIKQNLAFTDKVLSLITEITDNVSISHYGDYPEMEMKLVKEAPSIVYERVKLWEFQTQSAEDNQFNKMILDKALYFKNENAKNYSVQEMINYLKNPDEQLEGLGGILGASDAFEQEVSINEKIIALLKILNVLGFKTDTKKNRVISSFQDEEHLRVAHISDCFVSDDSRLLERASVVYGICECKTEIKSFKKFLAEL